MNDVIIKEVPLVNGKIAIFKYVCSDDPVHPLNEAIRLYVGDYKGIYHEMIDISMDNPWVRVIMTDINEIQEGCVELTTDILRDWTLKHLLNEK
jgi:hypothetical protein